VAGIAIVLVVGIQMLRGWRNCRLVILLALTPGGAFERAVAV
jgi:hypothetical protein